MSSAEKRLTGVKRGKTCNRCQRRKIFNRCQARENEQQPTGAKRGKTLNRCETFSPNNAPLSVFSIIAQVIIEMRALWSRIASYLAKALIFKMDTAISWCFKEKTNKTKENAIAVIITWAIILKQLFSSGSVILSNNPRDEVEYSLSLRRIIVKYSGLREAILVLKFLSQEHNTVTPARVQTRTTVSRVHHANLYATASRTKTLTLYFFFNLQERLWKPLVTKQTSLQNPLSAPRNQTQTQAS